MKFQIFKRNFATLMTLLVGVFGAKAGADTTTTVSSTPQTVIPGQLAPDFKLLNQEGNSISLKDYLGHWVVLYFYPKDFTGGCTLEAHNFQRDSAQYDKADAVILGVSVDSHASHKDFCSKEGLKFKLLADTTAEVSTLYNSVKTWMGHKMSARNTFIINPEGKVVRIFIGVKPTVHSEEVLAALKDLQTK